MQEEIFIKSTKESIEKLISSKELSSSKIKYYQYLKHILSQDLLDKDIDKKFDEIDDFSVSLAKLDFGKKRDVSDNHDIFDYFTTVLNVISEELDDSVLPTSLLMDLINVFSFPIVVANKLGYLIVYNNSFMHSFNITESQCENDNIFQMLPVNFDLEKDIDLLYPFEYQEKSFEITITHSYSPKSEEDFFIMRFQSK